ncbi:Mor transcription activator family protein [Vibrio bivalvicida]|uniref:Mor transcription activator family protein n=1 Tax=Vibrio bivalvicida TaxID=1276888 RepID=A0ABV4MLH6_9VIBR
MSTEQNFDLFGYENVTVEDIKKLQPSDHFGRSRWPELMLTVHELLKDELSKANVDENLALVLVARLCKDTGGTQYYFPSGDHLKHQLRNMFIWRDFNGQNVQELSLKYKLSTQKVYDALRDMRKIEVHTRQHNLF